MVKVRYKNVSDSLEKLAKPDMLQGRVSIGLEKNIGEFYYISVEDLISFKNQARRHFSQDEIENLAYSIKEHGIRHPLTIIACENEKGKFEVVSGERRLRAAKFIGLDKVPCILLQDKKIAEEIAIVENIHRQDLHPVELGGALEGLLKSNIFNSQEEISAKLGINKGTVSEYISFTSLSEEVKQYVIEHNVASREKLRKLLKLKDDKQATDQFLKSKNSLRANFSVIRVLFSENQLKIQHKGVSKLNPIQKQQLKKELTVIVDQL